MAGPHDKPPAGIWFLNDRLKLCFESVFTLLWAWHQRLANRATHFVEPRSTHLRLLFRRPNRFSEFGDAGGRVNVSETV
jgi:hypothetical protein